MNRQTLLSIYERLEAIIAKLPGPLQNAVIGELRPIKEIFLSQRLARIVLVGKPNVDASACFPALLGGDLQMIETKQIGRLGHLRVARKRRVPNPRCAPTERDEPDLERSGRRDFRGKSRSFYVSGRWKPTA